MKKIWFVNLDLAREQIDGIDVRINRNSFLQYANELCEDKSKNEIVFVSKNRSLLSQVEKGFVDRGEYKRFHFATREDVKKFVRQNKHQNNYFLFISGKEVDFHVAVHSKSLFIVPTWIPCEEKTKFYGVHVDTPEQLFKFIKTLNNQTSWYAKLEIENNQVCFSLMDARYGYYASSNEEKEMLIHFENLLKKERSRNYYEILLYHFLASMTNTTLFDDIELFGMVPSSNCEVNPDIHSFMTRVRYIKGKRLPKNGMTIENDNLLIRHTKKQKAHEAYTSATRMDLGASDEFSTLYINPLFKEKINNLKKQEKLNILIFDDYMTHGNTFNAIRNLLKSVGVNKVVFVSLGSFDKPFHKIDYVIEGSVYEPDYKYETIKKVIRSDFQYQHSAKDEVAELYDIFNS